MPRIRRATSIESTTPTTPATPAMPDLRITRLTAKGRAALRARIDRLRHETLKNLRPLLVEAERDERIVAEFERTQAELDQLEALLAEAIEVADPGENPGYVVMGARVVLEMPEGNHETVVIVHPAEAIVDDERISASSPLAQAMYGAREGDTVMVSAPRGAWPCKVISVSVEESASKPASRRPRRQVPAGAA